MSRHNAPFKFQVFSMAKFMNARCQCSIVVDALQFTDKMIQQHDVIKFTGKDALTGLDVDCVKQGKAACMSVLNGCTNLRKLKYNQRIHAYVNEMGAMIDSDTANSLVNTYVKSGNIEEAHAIFYQMDRPEVLSWNIMIGGYVNHGYAREALCLFSRMQKQGMKPDEVTMVHMLNACASLEDVEHGKKVHACIINGAVQPNVYVFNALIDMYVKCSNITIALQVFEEEHERNVVSCNALMAGYSKLGPAEECFHLLGRMEQEGIKPNEVTFVYILKACASLGNLDLGKQLHRHILKSRLKLNVFMGNGLMDMYCKCGDIVLAGQVFDQMAVRDVVSWNVIMAGYAKHGPLEVVFNLFEKMERAGVRPSSVTFLCLLNTCASLGDLDRGKKIHAEVLKTGLKQDINMWNTLIDMYSKCGSIKDARQLFDKMPRQDVVSWNVMITGYAKEGPAEKAFGLLRKIQQEGVKLNDDTYVSLLNACASLGALERGQHIHSQAIQDGLGFDAFVGSALVDMYAKSGSLDDAFHVLGKLPERDTVTWNALITGYALFGCCQTVVQLVNRMQKEDMELNHVTILALLSACSYAGLIHEGYKLFDHMTQHGYAATMEHNACIVDLLGRAGCLEEAVGFVENMPCQPGVSVWLSLLGACRVYGHVELAKFITNCFLNLEPKTIGNFVLLSNIYATAARWDEGRGHIGNSIMFL